MIKREQQKSRNVSTVAQRISVSHDSSVTVTNSTKLLNIRNTQPMHTVSRKNVTIHLRH